MTDTVHNPETAEVSYSIRVLYDHLVSDHDQIDKSLFADDFTFQPAESHPLASGPLNGVDEFLSNAFWASDDCDQVTFRIHRMNAAEKVSLQGYVAGIYKPTGKLFMAQILHIWTVENGKVTRLQELTDTEDLYQATQA